MKTIIEEKVETNGSLGSREKVVVEKASEGENIRNLIYFIFGIIESLIFFRILFMITGASRGSSFVDIIYSLSDIFVSPFNGIFRNFQGDGAETASVLEPGAIVALLVYPLLAMGIVRLINLIRGDVTHE